MTKQKSKSRKIPLYDLKISVAAKREVADSLASGWLSSGPKTSAFEKAIADLLHTRHAAAVNSCTVGLQILLGAIGAGRGKQVITTPFTFAATVEAIMATGATPVFADIDPRTLNIDAEEVARKVTSKTVAIVPVDMGGYPANYTKMKRVAKQCSVSLIADAAHSIGTTYKGKTISQLVDAAVYSFHATKNLTCGEGGMVVSRHKDLIAAVKLISSHGMTSGAYQRKKKRAWDYDIIQPGLKANMSEINAAIGLGQTTVFGQEQSKRTKCAERYLRNLAPFAEQIEIPQPARGYGHGWHLFIIKLHLSRLKISRDQFIHEMADRGIECGVHFKPIFELSWYLEVLKLSGKYFPNAKYAGRRVVSLPLFPGLKLSDVDYVCECIEEILKQHSR